MKIAVPIILAFLFSLCVGALMSWVAWEHNSQGEIHDGGVIDYGYLMMIFGSWVLMVMGAISPFLIGWMWIKSRSDQRRSM